MKKITIFLLILAIVTIGFYTYQKYNLKQAMSESGNDIKIDLNIKSNEEKIEENPEEDLPEEVAIKKEYTDFDLLNYIPSTQNYMVSPLSLKMALMMAANGANNETQKEITESFGVDDITSYNETIKTLIEEYNNNTEVTLNIANSIWLNKDIAMNIRFDEEFSNLILNYYQGATNEVTNQDAVTNINKWVEERTNGKIKNLIDNSDFLGALINTLYFKGSWEKQFVNYLTEQEEFTDIGGNIVEKDFMNKTDRFNYYEDDTMQMLRMPYQGNKTAMYVVIPRTNDMILDYNNAINNMVNKKVNVMFPKFKVEYSLELNDILKIMGINKAFSGEADFSSMFTKDSLGSFYISKVLQKTFIEVDENGTEAAAATAVIMNLTSAKPEPEEIINFIANKPFTYFIRDDVSGNILFLGKILY